MALIPNTPGLLRMVAAQDYVAARCCLLNGLLSGFVLGAQATEKLLKAYVLALEPATDLKKLYHGNAAIARECNRLDASFDAQRFAALFDKQEQQFKNRYPDNWKGSHSEDTSELADLDDFVMYIEDRVSLPDAEKYRSGVFALMFESELRGLPPHSFPAEPWLWNRNAALAARADSWRERAKEIYEAKRRQAASGPGDA